MILILIVFIYCIKNAIKNWNRGGSYIDFPDWINSKKATINLFQYAVTVALNHEKNGKNSKIISRIKPFIDKHN